MNGNVADSAASHDVRRVPIERAICADYAQFHSTIKRHAEPLIVSGILDGWPARKWSPQYFKTKWGGLPFTPSVDLPTSGRPYEQIWANYHRKMTLGEFVDLLEAAEKPCYVRRQLVERFPGAGTELDFERMFPRDGAGVDNTFIWFGVNTLTPLHFDLSNGVLCQMHGRKRVFMVGPKDSARLYPYPQSVTKSPVLPHQPDYGSFPRFRDATLFVGSIGPGDLLYIPRLWWHSIIAEGISISVSHEFGESVSYGDIASAISARGALGWLVFARDFVWCGMLGRTGPRRLFDDPPFGALVYGMLAGAVKRRLPALTRQ